MRPQWFLVLRTLVNGARRSFANPLRAVLTLLIVGWFGFTLLGNVFFQSSTTPESVPLLVHIQALKALLVVLHLYLLLTPLSEWRMHTPVPLFTESDVNFLFPSPQRRLHVFFFMLWARGLVSSLFLLLLLAIMVVVVGGELIAALIGGHVSGQLGFVWVYPVTYLLASFGLLAAAVLIAIKEREQVGFLKRLRVAAAVWFGVPAALLVWYGYIAWHQGEKILQVLVQHILHNPFVAVPLLPARMLADALLVPNAGWTTWVTAGLVFWSGFALLAHLLLARQEEKLYDFAASVASTAMSYRARAQNPWTAAYSDAIGRAARRGRVRRLRLFERWTPQGVMALLWRNGIVLLRIGAGIFFPVLVVFGVVMAVSIFTTAIAVPPTDASGWAMDVSLLLVFQHFGAMMALMFGHALMWGAIKRADSQKALPFTTKQVVACEVMPLVLLLLAFHTAYYVLLLCLMPASAAQITYSYVLGVSMALPLSLGMLLVMLTCPDQTDPTQRMLLGFLMLPMLLLVAMPALLVLVLGFVIGMPLWLNGAVVVLANIGATVLLTSITASRYAHFTLTE